MAKAVQMQHHAAERSPRKPGGTEFQRVVLIFFPLLPERSGFHGMCGSRAFRNCCTTGAGLRLISINASNSIDLTATGAATGVLF